MSVIKIESYLQKNFSLSVLSVLAFLLFCRVISMWYIPLNDSTEARYAEIARKMLETGNWVTPLHDYGVPFWAKPPLSTWLSAFSMHCFGVNEFAVRLPGLLLSMAVVWLVWDLATKHSGFIVGRIAALVLTGTLYFYLDAGTVMTDPALLFCITLSMVAFWHGFAGNILWSYVFFVGLGLGLLAKGPIAVVLIGLPIFFWMLVRGHGLCFWKRIPWVKGTFITLAIALPWYILAEIRTPGFLNYFFIGEHLNRFLVPGWTGDKYGMAHNQRWGMIWLYALGGLFPWSIVGGCWLLKHWKNMPPLIQDEDGWMLYLLFCMCIPLIFFTFASNIIYTYVFPSLPAFALLFAEVWKRSNYKSINGLLILSMSCGLIFLTGTLIFVLKPELVAKTQKPLVLAWIKQTPALGSSLIYWNDKTEFSAQFYTAGKVKSANNAVVLRTLLHNNFENYLVVQSKDLNQVPGDVLSHCNKVETLRYKETKIILFHCPKFNMIG
ncbi:MAG: glycosyltransferase family 39 protein [Legionella sp.]|nr:glycosyltransferase family 39 protein [Legionella sp.]